MYATRDYYLCLLIREGFGFKKQNKMYAASNCMQAPKYLETTISWDQKSVIDKFLEIFLKYVNIKQVWNLVGCRFYSCRTLITLWGSQVLPFLIKNVDLLLHRDSTFTTWRRAEQSHRCASKMLSLLLAPKRDATVIRFLSAIAQCNNSSMSLIS